jgi:hypothetical protein
MGIMVSGKRFLGMRVEGRVRSLRQGLWGGNGEWDGYGIGGNRENFRLLRKKILSVIYIYRK